MASRSTVSAVYLLHEVPGPYWVYPTHQQAELAAAERKQSNPDRRYEIHVCEFVGDPRDIHVRRIEPSKTDTLKG